MKALNYRDKDSEIIPISNSLFISNDVKGDDASLSLICKSNFLGHEINVYGSSESPLFLAKDVAEWIEHSDVSTMVRTVDEDEKLTQTLFVSGQRRECNFLTEDGLYEVLMQSRKPIAKQFKKGIKQILREIRTTGGYIATKQDDTPEEIMARALLLAQATLAKREERLKQLEAQSEQQQAIIELQEKKINQAAPKVDYYDKTLSSTGYLTVNMIAACLGISDIKLNKLLCQWGIQYKESRVYYLYSKYRNKGYTVHRPYPYRSSTGEIKTRQHMYWTEIGKKFIIEFYNSKMAA